MDLYLLIFTADSWLKEQEYHRHKDLFIALEKYFTLHLVPYTQADTIPAGAYKMAFISTGGVEDKVMRNFSLLPYPITLLSDGRYNSLAASLEIAGCLVSKNMKVKIIHGPADRMTAEVLDHHCAFHAKHLLKNKRIGVLGTPAPWLVASQVDYLLAARRWGVQYVDIPIEEVYRRFYTVTDDAVGPEASVLANRALACQDTTPEALLRSMRLYQAVRQLCTDEKLDAVALSCFNLVSQLDTTGCVALSLLNDAGIPAGCEGDLQSIMSMLMIQTVTGKPSFMGNPTTIDKTHNELILAHCSIPTQMVTDFILRDHMETGKGVSLQGMMHPEKVTLFKCGGECLDEYFLTTADLMENTNLSTACRTQFRLRPDCQVEYFLHHPLGNHHLLIQGDCQNLLNEFMQHNGCRRRE